MYDFNIYAQIAQSGPKSMILYIEGRSNITFSSNKKTFPIDILWFRIGYVVM